MSKYTTMFRKKKKEKEKQQQILSPNLSREIQTKKKAAINCILDYICALYPLECGEKV